jgi:hypothetical protein
VFTFATDVGVNFPTPIYGFATSDASIVAEESEIEIIDQGGERVDVPAGNSFFGVTGLITSLDFISTTVPTTDENVFIQLPNIVVGTAVDEPSGFASLAAGLVLLAVALSRFRRRGHRSQQWLFAPGR